MTCSTANESLSFKPSLWFKVCARLSFNEEASRIVLFQKCTLITKERTIMLHIWDLDATLSVIMLHQTDSWLTELWPRWRYSLYANAPEWDCRWAATSCQQVFSAVHLLLPFIFSCHLFSLICPLPLLDITSPCSPCITTRVMSPSPAAGFLFFTFYPDFSLFIICL